MCGRLVMSSTPADFIDYLQSTGALGDISIKNAFKNSFIPRYNVAPGANIFAITNSRDEEGLEINMFKWGLVPHWAKDDSFGAKCFNARGETMTTKPTFREAFKKSRCIVLADGYYEWKQSGYAGTTMKKYPYFIHNSNSSPMFLAGLYEPQTNSSAIITIEADSKMREIHHRRPAFIDVDSALNWLKPEASQDDLLSIIQRSSDKNIEAYTVSTLVNKSYLEGASLIEKTDSLF